jgi:pilus assembly protein CpaB
MRYGVLIAAVVVAAIAAIAVMRMSASEPAPPVVQAAPQQTVSVYVASKPIAIGTTIDAEMIAAQPWPAHLVLEGFVIADGKTDVVGMVARSPFQQSEPLILNKLANPNDPNFLAGDLPAGMRVVTIAVNETDAVAGFIFPGDQVDVIFTHDVDKWEYPPSTGGLAASGAASAPIKSKETVTETLLTNVKVLAIDQRASSVGATDKNGSLIIPRSASLMVSQADAQRVRLASKTGSLSLVLRALADKESADPLVLTAPTDITQSQSAVGGPSDAGIKIVRGAPATAKETESGSLAVSRGAPGTSGAAVPLPPMPAGSSVVNPGSMAIP